MIRRILIFSISWICVFNLYAQQKTYQFTRLDVRQGLSHNQVNAIFRDSTGFVWFGTMSGLNRFDGYDFTVFRNDLNDSSTLSDNYVTRIFELPENRLWVATRNGNNIYDPDTESFLRNDQDYLSTLSLPGGAVSFIKKDKEGNFWFVYQNLGGVYKYSSKEHKPVRFSQGAADGANLDLSDVSALDFDKQNNAWLVHRNGVVERIDHQTGRINWRGEKLKNVSGGKTEQYEIMVDGDGDCWITVHLSGTPGGLYWYKTTDDSIEYLSRETGSVRLNNNIISDVVQDDEGKIWVGTDHGGVNIINKKTKAVQYLLNDAEDHTSVSQNTIWSVYKDREGVIWLGTFKQGVNYYSSRLALFDLYKHKTLDARSLPFEDVNKFAEDEKGNLWIGTNGGGLLYFDRTANSYKSYRHDPRDPNSISSDVIVSLCIDHEKKLWVGTYFGGLNCFDGRRFIHFRHDSRDSGSVSDDSIWEIFEDTDKNLWIGTLSGGLNLFNRKTKRFTRFNVENRSTHSNYISTIIEDRKGRILFGTSNGIDWYAKSSAKFEYLGHNDNEPNSLSNNNVMAILEDSRGLIWVGTREGLNLMHRDGKGFSIFRKEDGLPDNTILTVLEDNLHNLWLSTPNGISQAVVNQKADGEIALHFINYDESNGLQGREFNDKAGFKTRSGELILGGPYGFNIFKPDRFPSSKPPAPIVFTRFQVFNIPVLPGTKLQGTTILNKSVTQRPDITLRYNQNVFSIAFSSLGLGMSVRNKFQYKLEGFNNEWLSTDGGRRTLTFTNIDPGKYRLRVRHEGDSDPGQEAYLQINILPPFWKTTPAYFLYLGLGIILLLLGRRLTIRRANIRFQMALQKRESERVHELDMLKLKFFTNVSHEFRTPISLILSPVEQLLKHTEDNALKRQYQLIYRNARRLLGLVNQLLDFRKLEKNELRLYPTVGNIVSFVKEITLSFTDLAEKKNIDYHFHASAEDIQTSFDPDKLERILFNLLSNAFKFTSEKGRVSVEVNGGVKEGKDVVQISVGDSGIGIPSDSREKIFERYFQAEGPDSILGQGSGIGLAISKEFVKLHGGEITVDENAGGGTLFTVCLPVSEYTGPSMQRGHNETEIQMHKPVEQRGEKVDYDGNQNKKSVLLIDDNDDIRFYLKDNLGQDYVVYQATRGAEGWDKAIEFLPDLIISDIMMPDMDGLTLCKKIKQDPLTSHIPVILLTARTTDEQVLAGYKTGAIEYVTKPFSFELLQARIRNILAFQESLKHRFQKEIEIDPTEIVTNPVDEEFISRALKVVEDNLSGSEFSVENLSKAMFMSRVALYKKLLAITGKTPSDFIRSVRMKKAAQLLRKTQMTVSEIAYEVGFNNPKYFTKYFKKEFNTLPTSYRLEQGKRGV